MNGVVRTVVQLIYGSGLQRWLLRIGLALTILGFAALKTGWLPGAQPLFAFTGILAAGISVISPIVVGAIMFRALAAPRAVQLIRHGRLKLVLGAFSTQVLLALFIAASVTILLRDGPGAHASLLGTTTASGFMAVIFAYAFSILTFIFLNFYWAMQNRLTAFVWLVYFVPNLLSHAFPQLHLDALLDSPRGLLTVLTVSLLAWPVFAAIFIRQRNINIIGDWKLVGVGSSPRRRTSASATHTGTSQRSSQHRAVQILLTGIASGQKVMFATVAIAGVAFLAAMLVTTGGKVSSRSAFEWALMICLFAGIAPAVRTGLMTRRAKSLWLTGRMGREELFTAVERQSWSTVLPVAGAAMALAALLLVVKMHGVLPPALLVSVLAMPLTIGASGIYVSMLLVRGRQLRDTLLLAGYTVLLVVEILSAIAQSPTSILPQLLAANIIAIPLLRHLGLRRWQNIDWLIHKRSIAQLIG